MKMYEALQDILSPHFDVDAMLTDPEGSPEFVVAMALTLVDEEGLDTQAARELLAWDERRRAGA